MAESVGRAVVLIVSKPNRASSFYQFHAGFALLFFQAMLLELGLCHSQCLVLFKVGSMTSKLDVAQGSEIIGGIHRLLAQNHFSILNYCLGFKAVFEY